MARIIADCRWCRRPMVAIFAELDIITDPSPAVLSVCRCCDTSPATNPGNRLHAGPPRLPGSKNGWFLPTE